MTDHALAFADHGLCAGMDQDLFFPPVPSQKITALHVAAVRPICQACPVFTACHTWAVPNETDGIWAATSPNDRRRLRKVMGIAAPPVDVDLAMATVPEPSVESLTAEGRSGAWIADVLGITRWTVVRHRTAARKTA